MQTIKETNFKFKNQRSFYRGKVRDVYSFDDKIVMVASDRISAFDVVLSRAIPFKGQVLNQIAALALEKTADICKNWVKEIADPNVTIGFKCEPFPVEMVVRAYLSGHAAREYKGGKRVLCGVVLPEGLKENDPLPTPIITPTTKAHEGHDEDISRADILKKGLISLDDYQKLEQYSLKLFERGTAIAKERGLILVDTKYEFGKVGKEIYVIDEIHTPDSSRYFYEDTYQTLQDINKPQRQLSKEFVRQWLISNNFQGKEGQSQPLMTDNVVNDISKRYIELFEAITGTKFVHQNYNNALSRIEKNILAHL